LGLLLYSAEEITGWSKSCWENAASVTDSWSASGGWSLHWKLNTLGWSRRSCAIAVAEFCMTA